MVEFNHVVEVNRGVEVDRVVLAECQNLGNEILQESLISRPL